MTGLLERMYGADVVRRVRVARWAFGTDDLDGLPPYAFADRPAVNPDRHARIRLKHFTHAIVLGLAGHMAHGEFGDDDFAMVWSPSMLSLGVGYLAAVDACDWGVA